MAGALARFVGGFGRLSLDANARVIFPALALRKVDGRWGSEAGTGKRGSGEVRGMRGNSGMASFTTFRTAA